MQDHCHCIRSWGWEWPHTVTVALWPSQQGEPLVPQVTPTAEGSFILEAF